MNTSVALKTATGHCRCTFYAITAIEQEGYDTMEDIRLSTESGFKTMLKMLLECTAIKTQDISGNTIIRNKPVAIYNCVEQLFNVIILCNKMM